MAARNKRTLLLVEDEVIISMGKKKDLEKYGYNVITINTGEKAVLLAVENTSIDLILMDIDLGKGIDGTETAELILNKCDIPIVFLSSHMEPEIVEKTEKITSYGYVVKNSSITVLDASIKMAFKLFDARKAINIQNMQIKAGNENLRVTIEELETSRNRLTSIFRAAPTGIGVIENRIILEVNQKFCDMTGYLEKELLGNSSRLLYPSQEAFDFVGKEKYEQIKSKGTGTVETQLLCKDGRIIDVLLSSTPLFIDDWSKGVTFTALDITARKQVENVQKEIDEKYSKVFQNSPYPMMIIDTENGCYADVNLSMINDIEFSREELIGKNAVELGILNPETEQEVRKIISDTRQFSDMEITVRTKSGKTLHGLASGQIIELKGHLYLFHTIMNITKLRKTEHKLKQQLLEKEIILKETHHRMKNNFNSIESLLALQSNSLTNKEASSIIKDTISRVDSMRLLYEKMLISDEYMATSVKDYLNDLIITMINIFSDNVKPTVEIQLDDVQLNTKQLFPLGLIVNELITNIMKYAYIGRNSGSINISLREKNGNITLVIEDNGNGLPEGLDINNQKGFGLFLVKMLCEQLQGSFKIDNHSGVRSTVKFPV
jgi:PAS domain S-box-containing protein